MQSTITLEILIALLSEIRYVDLPPDTPGDTNLLDEGIIDSITIVQLAGEIELLTGREVTPRVMFECGTLDDFVNAINGVAEGL